VPLCAFSILLPLLTQISRIDIPKPTADELIKKGDAAINQGKYDEAITHFSDAINADSASFQPVCSYAMFYIIVLV
jgi:outer membrane protein assembly factor BamD (BamD/ComL family)